MQQKLGRFSLDYFRKILDDENLNCENEDIAFQAVCAYIYEREKYPDRPKPEVIVEEEEEKEVDGVIKKGTLVFRVMFSQEEFIDKSTGKSCDPQITATLLDGQTTPVFYAGDTGEDNYYEISLISEPT